MDASADAFAHGVRQTRSTLRAWQRTPGVVLGRWFAGSALAATGLLCAVWLVATVFAGYQQVLILEPPFAVGGGDDVLSILRRNMLVLALHAMACVAGLSPAARCRCRPRATAASRAGYTNTEGGSRSASSSPPRPSR